MPRMSGVQAYCAYCAYTQTQNLLFAFNSPGICSGTKTQVTLVQKPMGIREWCSQWVKRLYTKHQQYVGPRKLTMNLKNDLEDIGSSSILSDAVIPPCIWRLCIIDLQHTITDDKESFHGRNPLTVLLPQDLWGRDTGGIAEETHWLTDTGGHPATPWCDGWLN